MKELRNRYCEGSASVISVCSSIDVAAVACGSEVTIYRMQLHKICTATVPGTVKCLAWSPSGRALAVGSDKGCFIVNTETGGVFETYVTESVKNMTWLGTTGNSKKITPRPSKYIESNFDRMLLPTTDDTEPAGSPSSETYFRLELLKENQLALTKGDCHQLHVLTDTNTIYVSPYGNTPAAVMQISQSTPLVGLTVFHNGLLLLGHTESGEFIPISYKPKNEKGGITSHFEKISTFSQIIEICNCLETNLKLISDSASLAEAQIQILTTPPKDWSGEGSLWENLFYKGPTGGLSDFVLKFLPKVRERIETGIVTNVSRVTNIMGGLILRGVDLISGLTTLLSDLPEVSSEISNQLVDIKCSLECSIAVATQVSSDSIQIIAWYSEMYNYCNLIDQQPTQAAATAAAQPIEYSRNRIMQLAEIPVGAWNRTEASVSDVTARIKNFKGFLQSVCNQRAGQWANEYYITGSAVSNLNTSNKCVSLTLTGNGLLICATAVEGGVVVEVMNDAGPDFEFEKRFSTSSAFLQMSDPPIAIDIFSDKDETSVSLAVVHPNNENTCSLSNIPIMSEGQFCIYFSSENTPQPVPSTVPVLPLPFSPADRILISCSRRDLAAVSAVVENGGTSLSIIDFDDNDEEEEEEEEEN